MYTDYQDFAGNPHDTVSQRITQMYPELYRRLYPQAMAMAEQLDPARMTRADVDAMADEMIRRAGLWHEMADDMDAVSTANAFGFRRRPRQEFLRDIAGILLLRELFDRHHRRRW